MDKNLESVLGKLDVIVNNYHVGKIDCLHLLLEANKHITTIVYYLGKERSNYHKKWQEEVFNSVREGNSVSRAENEAHVSYPELYLLRQIVNAAEGVSMQMAREIKQLTKEYEQHN